MITEEHLNTLKRVLETLEFYDEEQELIEALRALIKDLKYKKTALDAYN